MLSIKRKSFRNLKRIKEPAYRTFPTKLIYPPGEKRGATRVMETAWAFALVHFSSVDIDPIYWVLWIARLHCRKAWTGLCLLTRTYISPAIDTYIYLPILSSSFSHHRFHIYIYTYSILVSTVFLEKSGRYPCLVSDFDEEYEYTGEDNKTRSLFSFETVDTIGIMEGATWVSKLDRVYTYSIPPLENVRNVGRKERTDTYLTACTCGY